MSDQHAAYRFSVTIQSDDLAVVNCTPPKCVAFWLTISTEPAAAMRPEGPLSGGLHDQTHPVVV